MTRMPLFLYLILVPGVCLAGNLDRHRHPHPEMHPICGVNDDNFARAPSGLRVPESIEAWQRFFPFKACRSLLIGGQIGFPNHDTRTDGERALDELLIWLLSDGRERNLSGQANEFILPCRYPFPPRGIGPPVDPEDIKKPVCTKEILALPLQEFLSQTAIADFQSLERILDNLDLDDPMVVQKLVQARAWVAASSKSLSFKELSSFLESQDPGVNPDLAR